MKFPEHRARRLRQNAGIRKLVRETGLEASNFMQPVFVVPGSKIKEEISSMPGVYRFSSDMICSEVEEVKKCGIPGVLIFGVPEKKDDKGTGAADKNGIVQVALKNIKKEFPDIIAATDVCLCAYTKSGHCGILDGNKIDNDRSLAALSKMALSHARAGADMVAPSDMMDGRVAAIRKELDDSGFTDTIIMSYSAKYASAFYGPFREAAHSAPAFGDRKTYQMDPANSAEAIKEMKLDIDEGADIVMVKPALAYLDIIQKASQVLDVPIAAYSVSGEYSMILSAGAKGLLDGQAAMMEALLSMKRAGARIIITYYAKEAAKIIKQARD
jgi:porphobilinogen synthase